VTSSSGVLRQQGKLLQHTQHQSTLIFVKTAQFSSLARAHWSRGGLFRTRISPSLHLAALSATTSSLPQLHQILATLHYCWLQPTVSLTRLYKRYSASIFKFLIKSTTSSAHFVVRLLPTLSSLNSLLPKSHVLLRTAAHISTPYFTPKLW
jgi:hypothetical protein